MSETGQVIETPRSLVDGGRGRGYFVIIFESIGAKVCGITWGVYGDYVYARQYMRN